MKSLKKITGFSLVFFSLMLVISQSVIVSGTVQAQEPTPRPPPGGSGSSGGSGDESGSSSSGSSVPIAPKTGLYGFVYNYSTGGYEPGVQVYADGDGWHSEAVTDSNGFYHMTDLGFGKATVNLRLPPDAHPAAPNWPARLLATEGHQLDLGYYWRDTPPIPVLLSGIIEGDSLIVKISNDTDENATGGFVEIVTPGGITIEPVVNAGQGKVTYAAHRTKVEPGDIMPGQMVTINVPLGFSLPGAGQFDEPVQVMFTYNEQITPQAVEPGLDGVDVQAMALFDNTHGDKAATDSTIEVNEAPVASSSAATDNTSETMSPESNQTTEMEQPAGTAKSEKTSLLPETGNETQSVNLAIALLALLLVLALGVGGWYSVSRAGE